MRIILFVDKQFFDFANTRRLDDHCLIRTAPGKYTTEVIFAQVSSETYLMKSYFVQELNINAALDLLKRCNFDEIRDNFQDWFSVTCNYLKRYPERIS